MRKGLILQPRDFEILRTVYEYTVASLGQLKGKHFGTSSAQTASNRLCALVRSRYLKSYRVGVMIYQGKERQVNKVFALTSLGIHTLSLKSKGAVHRSEIIHPQFYSLVHDLILNEVLEILKGRSRDQRVVNSKLLKLPKSRTEQVPDLVALGEDGEIKEAIELELTAKSEKRYRDIVTNYRLSSRFKKVTFIVEDRSVKEKLWRIITGERDLNAQENNHHGKFYFQNLEDLLPSQVTDGITLDLNERKLA